MSKKFISCLWDFSTLLCAIELLGGAIELLGGAITSDGEGSIDVLREGAIELGGVRSIVEREGRFDRY